MSDPSTPVPDSDLLTYDGVLGIGRGVRIRGAQVTDEEVITVYVRNKVSDPPRAVPATALVKNGHHTFALPTDVVELPPALAPEAPEEAQFPRAGRAGDAVSTPGVRPGTLGCIARRRSDRAPVIVSCYHVLVDSEGECRPGPVAHRPHVLMDVVMPDGKYRHDISVGVVLTGARTDHPQKLDVAVARITREPRSGGPIRMIRGLEGHPRDYLPASQAVNRRVIKSGAVTGITCGIVTSVAEQGQTPDGLPLRNTLVITNLANAQQCDVCENSHNVVPISTGGDSGALFVTVEPDLLAVGLLWGGDGHRIAYAVPWETIENTLELDVTILD